MARDGDDNLILILKNRSLPYSYSRFSGFTRSSVTWQLGLKLVGMSQGSCPDVFWTGMNDVYMSCWKRGCQANGKSRLNRNDHKTKPPLPWREVLHVVERPFSMLPIEDDRVLEASSRARNPFFLSSCTRVSPVPYHRWQSLTIAQTCQIKDPFLGLSPTSWWKIFLIKIRISDHVFLGKGRGNRLCQVQRLLTGAVVYLPLMSLNPNPDWSGRQHSLFSSHCLGSEYR